MSTGGSGRAGTRSERSRGPLLLEFCAYRAARVSGAFGAHRRMIGLESPPMSHNERRALYYGVVRKVLGPTTEAAHAEICARMVDERGYSPEQLPSYRAVREFERRPFGIDRGRLLWRLRGSRQLAGRPRPVVARGRRPLNCSRRHRASNDRASAARAPSSDDGPHEPAHKVEKAPGGAPLCTTRSRPVRRDVRDAA